MFPSGKLANTMNDLENYKAILESHFGPGAPQLPNGSSRSNNLLGGLNHSDFGSFHSAFFQRLAALSACYPDGDANRGQVWEILKRMANNSLWEGAYAELVALDFLNSNRDYLSGPLSLSKPVPATETLASSLGKKNVDFDGYYYDLETWIDIKILGDKAGEILGGIIAEVKTHLNIPATTISPEYPLAIDYELLGEKRDALKDELAGAINPVARTTFIKSRILPELNYRLLWGSGVLTSVKTYTPYAHAANHHKLLFSHLKKFSRKSPSLIVFVVFPWFSESVLGAGFANEVLYRALCRRFFCQYARNSDSAKQHLESFVGPETLAQVTEKLSGVLFLEDTSLKAFDPKTHSVRGFAYLNPNAANKVSRHFRQYLSSLQLLVDDFEDDNY
jgi:hypothetical protein